MTERRTPKSRIPDFASVEEEAKFWDSHDFTEFEDETQPVKVRFAKNLSQVVALRLDAESLAVLRALAKDRGIGPTTLARMWILERLKAEPGARAR